ncbi:MAG: Calx-beta domain-containing protein, partial [Chthoniobacteraceae bacterium]
MKAPLSSRTGPPRILSHGIVELLETRIALAAGSLDLTFGGGDGVAVIDQFAKQLIESGDAVAVQADGKILIAGSATDGFGRFFPDIALVRLNADGSRDLSFGTEGQVLFDFGGDYYSREEAFAVAVQADGKIVVGGRSTLTNTAVEPIDYDFALARFTSAGVVDAGFGTGGFVRTDFGSRSEAVRGLAITTGGLIYAVGDSGGDAAVARYTSAGVLDTGFDADGKVLRDLGGADSLRGAVVQADGKLVAVGTTALDFAAVRFTTTGALDAGFGNAGVALVDFGNTGEEARAVALDATERIVLGGGVRVGLVNDFAFARLTTAGVLDATFGIGGKTSFNVSLDPASTGQARVEGLAIQADGAIVAAGTAPGFANRPQWHAVRVDDTGTLDASFGNGGVTRLALDIATHGKTAGVALSAGQLVIAGTRQSDDSLQPYSLGVMKLTTAGVLDPAFDGDGVALFDVRTSAQNGGEVSIMLADGRIMLAENIRVSPGNALAGSIIAVTRLLADGSRDATFGVNGTVNVDLGLAAARPQAILVEPDGKIVLAGTRFYLPAPEAALASEAALARLDANGVLDPSFGTGGVVSDQFYGPVFRQGSEWRDVVRQPDGKLVVLGYGSASFEPNLATVLVARYNTDGTLDTSFAGDGRAELTGVTASNFTMDTLRLLPDGRLLLAGEDNRGQLQLARLTSSGVLDTTFDGDGIVAPRISGQLGGVIVNGDGTITVGASAAGTVSSGGVSSSSGLFPVVLQFTADGALDPSFDGDGALLLDSEPGRSLVGSFLRDSMGRYLMGIGFTDLSDQQVGKLVRFNADGSRDQHFGAEAGVDFAAAGVNGGRTFLRADGTVVIVGPSSVENGAALARFVGDVAPPAAGLLSFSIRKSSVAETVGNAIIDVARIGGSAGTVMVNYAITGGTAQAGSDYTNVSGMLTFGPGVTSQQISVQIASDSIGEIAETIELTLTNPTGGAALQNPAKHDVTIRAHNGGLGSIDPNFGVNGVALSDHSTPTGSGQDQEQITDMAFAPDGDIVAVGYRGGGGTGASFDFFLSRFHADGSPDLDFGDGGSVTTDLSLSLDRAESVGVLADGRILVAGFANTPSFGDSIHYGGTAESLGGAFTKQLALIRYLADGTLDRSYGNSGFVVFDPRALQGRTGVATEVIYEDYVILPTGEVVAGIAVYDFLNTQGDTTPVVAGLIRFRADGMLDTTFGGDGLAESGLQDSLHSSVAVARQTDGKLLLSFGTGDFQGPVEERTAVVRFNADGSLDTSFGTGGRVQFDAFIGEQSSEYPQSIALQQDGRILIGGYYAPFGNDGETDPDVAARDDSGFIVRLTANGTLDTTFSGDGVVLYHGLFPRTSPAPSFIISDAAIYDVAQLPNGRIVAVGESINGPGPDSGKTIPVVLEFLADGTPDPQFGINGAFRVTAVRTDGIADAALLVTPANEIIAGFGGKLSSDSSPNSQFTLQRLATQGAAGRFEWSLAASETEEADGFASLILQRLGGTMGTATVSYAFASGTAQAGADFTPLGGTITFLEGQTSVEILVPITTGDALENTETFTATLASPTGGATLGAITTHTVSILDGPDRFEFSSPIFNFLEGSQLVSVQVLRKGGATGQVSVDYSLRGLEAVNGVDFDALEGGTLAFAAGQKTTTITFALRADDIVEGRESIALRLLNPRGGPVLGAVANATASIYDSEPGKGMNAGALDADFGDGGVTDADVFLAGTAEQGRDVVKLPGGKLLVVGESGGRGSDFLLARYLADGTLDTTFGTGGTVTTDFFGSADSAQAVALDAQGRIVVAGWALREGRADFAVARYLANGTLDVSFDGDGRATVDFDGFDDRASSLAFTPGGGIALGGRTSGVQKLDMAVAVLTGAGALDTSFSKDGRTTVDFAGKADVASAVLVQGDGGIVLGGTSSRISRVTTETASDFAFVRFTPAGDLDKTFSSDGRLLASDNLITGTGTSNSVLNAMLLRNDGRINFGGSIGGDILLGEVSPAGELTFYTKDNFTLAQLGGGPALTSSVEVINDLAFAADGKLVVTGHTIFPGETTQRLFVQRYESDYRLDVDFGVSSISVLPTLGSGRALAFAEDGNVVVVGDGFEVAQLLRNSAAPKEGAFSLDAVSYSIAENGGALTVTVSRSHETNYGFVTVDYAVVGITAQPGQDFTPVAGTLTFRETETVKSFTIPIINDVLMESVELFGVVLTNPTGGAQLSSASYATVAIPANDPQGTRGTFINTAPGFSDFVFEGLAFVTVNRSGGSLGAVSINYHTEDGTAKAGEDYTPAFGTIDFANGETSKQIFILTTDDDRIEGTETFFLKFTTPTGGSTLDLGFDTMTISMPDSVPAEAFP